MENSYDIIVVGAGHAGCEAAAAAANMGSKVLLLTMDMGKIAQMSCNPAMGGIAKGQIVREVDALGGYSGIVTDISALQFRMLNRSKGPAMWSPRAQCDRAIFSSTWKNLLENTPNVHFWQDSVNALLIENNKVIGVSTVMGAIFKARAVVLTNGTFLNGIIHIGKTQIAGGRMGDGASYGLSEQLKNLGFEVGRMKTGTPARIDGRTIDFSKLTRQDGDDPLRCFSYLNDKGCFAPLAMTVPRGTSLQGSVVPSPSLRGASAPKQSCPYSTLLEQLDCFANARNDVDPSLRDSQSESKQSCPYASLLEQLDCFANARNDCFLLRFARSCNDADSSLRGALAPKQSLPCYIAHTSKKVHDILKEGFADSPLFSGTIKGVGPRYCPSIEDKLCTFADKDTHQLFLEPEGWDTNEYYIQGFSSSLPMDIQVRALREIEGLEKVEIFRPGYAIEYDYFPPVQLRHSLETKLIENLYFAGQINGTTGYEEAAAQGLMAGINAHLKLNEQPEFILRRDQAYIGVLIDDLVTKGVDEPYRMFTSRAEYRILLRQDNADMRLTELSYNLGLASEERYQLLLEKKEAIDALLKYIQDTSIRPEEINPYLALIGSAPITQSKKMVEILSRPEVTIKGLFHVEQSLRGGRRPPKQFCPIFQIASLTLAMTGALQCRNDGIGVRSPCNNDGAVERRDCTEAVIARRDSAEAILSQNPDCFADARNDKGRFTPLAMTVPRGTSLRGAIAPKQSCPYESLLEQLDCFALVPRARNDKGCFASLAMAVPRGTSLRGSRRPPKQSLPSIFEAVEIIIKYKGYIERERALADKMIRLEDVKIPRGFDFDKLSSVSIEGRQKLKRYQPETIGQASRITGISPADISVMLVYFGR